MHSQPRGELRIYVDEHEAPYRFGVLLVHGHLPDVQAARKRLEELRGAGKLKHAHRDAKDKYRRRHVESFRAALADILRTPPWGVRVLSFYTRSKVSLLEAIAEQLDQASEPGGRLICDPMSWSGPEKEARLTFLRTRAITYEDQPKGAQEVWLTAIDYALYFGLL